MRRGVWVERLLAEATAIPITTQVARVHAEAWSSLEEAGTPVAAHDLWIAATALAHGLPVATANARDFERVPGLAVVAVP